MVNNPKKNHDPKNDPKKPVKGLIYKGYMDLWFGNK
jgi:hypothetical protein